MKDYEALSKKHFDGQAAEYDQRDTYYYGVSVYARGRRLESMSQDGLLVKYKGKIRKASVKVLSRLEAEDRYELVFLTVRENQQHAAPDEIR